MIACVTVLWNPDELRLKNYVCMVADLEAAGLQVWTAAAGVSLPAGARGWQYDVGPQEILWQKERLLNLAVQQLPAEVDVVAWIDADVIFDCESIAQAITHAARVWPVAQLWQYVTMLGADQSPDAWPGGVKRAESIAAYCYQRRGEKIDPTAGHPGFAWVMRREVWDAIGGLYECDLAGTGDGIMAGAWLGAGPANPYLGLCPPAMRRHALAWCQAAYSIVRGRVGYVPIAIGHLYHGALVDRRYKARREQLVKAGYDPTAHVVARPGELLTWSATAPIELVAWSKSWLNPGGAGSFNPGPTATA